MGALKSRIVSKKDKVSAEEWQAHKHQRDRYG